VEQADFGVLFDLQTRTPFQSHLFEAENLDSSVFEVENLGSLAFEVENLGSLAFDNSFYPAYSFLPLSPSIYKTATRDCQSM
jgi:hypothetical protein